MTHLVVKQVTDLLHQHGDSYLKCKGCSICKKIEKLRPTIDKDPKKRFRHILGKGQDMTRSDIELLLENDVTKKEIENAIGMTRTEFNEMIQNFGIVKNQGKGSVEMSKGITKEQYLELSNAMSEKEKAKALGISYGTLWTLKKSWDVARPKRDIEVEPVKEEASLPLTNLEKELKQRIAELEKEVELYKPFEKQVKDLEAAAEDLENENAAHIDKICELEDELRLVDGAINTWKERALKAEEARELLSRQYRNLAEELDETHTVNSALKTTLKAVL